MPRKYTTTPRPILHVIGPSVAYVPLTQGQFSIIDADDAAIIGQWSWYALFNKKNHVFYAARYTRKKGYKGKTIRMHSFILGLSPGKERVITADHVNPERTLDNRRANLRPATMTQQCANRRRRSSKNATSKYRGVSYVGAGSSTGKQWRAGIRIKRKQIHLGVFTTEEEASQAYMEAARHYYGEFARQA